MSEENNNNAGGEGTDSKDVHTDAFGNQINADGSEYVPDIPTEGGEEEGKDKEKEEEGKEGEEQQVKALEDKISEYSRNLIGQKDVIERLQQKVKSLEEGKKDGGKEGETEAVLFKDVKFSKDLSQDERDDMTETEIRLFDQNAQMQTAMNEMFSNLKNTKESDDRGKGIEDLNGAVKEKALLIADEALKANPELATDVQELRNKIIVEFNEFNNEGLTEEKLEARLKKALTLVPNYTPPKEQEKKGDGGAVKKNDSSDPFGVNSVVQKLSKGNDGSYDL